MRNSDEKNKKEYMEKRFNNNTRNGDDRCEESKETADAILRGQLGCERANKIIDKIDEIKSWR